MNELNKPKIITSTVNYLINDAKAEQFDDVLYQLDNTAMDGLKEPLTLKDILFAKELFPDENVSFNTRMKTYVTVWKALEWFRDSLSISKVVDGDNVTYTVNTTFCETMNKD